MKINVRGYWENETEEGHGVDVNLAEGLKVFFNRERIASGYDHIDVMDVGCGTGFYTQFLKSDLIRIKGFDGNPNTPIISKGLCGVLDFSLPHKEFYNELWNKKLECVNWTLCLEVGEHIPKKYESNFLENLTFLSIDGIVLSWSTPNLGGDGHVNPQTNEHIIDKLKEYDFTFDIHDTWTLRNSASPYPQIGWWFGQTLMVFRRNLNG